MKSASLRASDPWKSNGTMRCQKNLHHENTQLIPEISSNATPTLLPWGYKSRSIVPTSSSHVPIFWRLRRLRFGTETWRTWLALTRRNAWKVSECSLNVNLRTFQLKVWIWILYGQRSALSQREQLQSIASSPRVLETSSSQWSRLTMQNYRRNFQRFPNDI